jgi:hypothetical protein
MTKRSAPTAIAIPQAQTGPPLYPCQQYLADVCTLVGKQLDMLFFLPLFDRM